MERGGDRIFDMKPGGRKIGRYVLNGLAALSLLLAAVVAVLWVRGVFWASDQYVKELSSDVPFDSTPRSKWRLWPVAGNGFLLLGSSDGCLWCWYDRQDPPGDSAELGWSTPPVEEAQWDWRTPVELQAEASSNGDFIQIKVADWLILVGLMILPGALVARHWRRDRKVGLCRKCNYDLRASKDRCPECGEPIPMGDTAAVGR